LQTKQNQKRALKNSVPESIFDPKSKGKFPSFGTKNTQKRMHIKN